MRANSCEVLFYLYNRFSIFEIFLHPVKKALNKRNKQRTAYEVIQSHDFDEIRHDQNR